MKTYFRLLSFAKPIEKFAIPYIIFTLLYVLFSSMVYVLLPSLLNTLFGNNAIDASNVTHAVKHAAFVKQPGWLDLSGWFKYYLNYFINTHGQWGALQFVCALIVVTILVGNFFRYLSARTMENLRVHTLLNLRRKVFNNVMDMHLGYFNYERKGDIISKIASDVQVVQFSVTATLQVIFKEPFQMLIFLFFLFKISVTLTLWSLLVVPISGFIISKIVKKL